MALVNVPLGEVDGAVLSLTADDVAMEVTQVKLNATNATNAVRVIVYQTGTTIEKFNQVFQPGSNITVNIPPGQRAKFTLADRVKPDGTHVLVLVEPEYRFERA